MTLSRRSHAQWRARLFFRERASFPTLTYPFNLRMSAFRTPSPDNPTNIIWSTYLDAAQDDDQARPKNWEGNTAGILTFTGLFAATVAAFTLESYKQLSPDTGEQSVALLSQILSVSVNGSSHLPLNVAPPAPFRTTPSAIITNALWFSSLLLSLFCALLSTLAQQWSRDYVHDINRRRVLHEDLETRVYNHIFIRMGINRYGMDQLVSWIVALVHLAVFLFVIGLAVFLFPIDTTVAAVALGVLGTFAMLYCLASLLPLIDKSCPYRTPFTHFPPLRPKDLAPWPYRAPAVDIHEIASRRIQDGHQFLASDETIFLWDCSGRHVPDESFERMVKGLLALPCGPADQHIYHHLCADDAFAKRLYWHMRNRMKDAIDPSLFTLLSLLSERMFRSEVERAGSASRMSRTSGYYMNTLGLVSRLAVVDGEAKLRARLCIANVRWSFLNLYRYASQKIVTAPLSEDQALSSFDNTSSGEFALNNRHPSVLHVLLSVGHYSFALNSWLCRAESVLVPLHAESCCKSWKHTLAPENIAHLAACSALTMVSHVLEALSADNPKDAALLRDAPNSIMTNIDSAYPMLRNERRAPSPQFISIIRDAGLEEWLKPGSDYSSEPRDGPFYQHRYLLYANDCMSILRTLARSVDFSAYNIRKPERTALIGRSSRPFLEAFSPSITLLSPPFSPTTSTYTGRTSVDSLQKIESDLAGAPGGLLALRTVDIGLSALPNTTTLDNSGFADA
ncbi:unnamed protein product [Peniophora sp. CBMAI 1063]|nr:unnamed protein product [Peniophora sp. CBMAI 1063]